MGYIKDLRKVIGHQPLILAGVAFTVAYISKNILGEVLKSEGVETTGARFFSVSELPDQLNPLIKDLMKQFTVSV